ncbi:MAG: hypothetical protein JJT99_08180 [Rhodobacteraceae bacterium]|nr:hypothetical protein [Paracoccaceae bacterium]
MAQNPELHLWRAVLALALRDDDAARWIRTQDAATVCALAGLDHDAVVRAFNAGLQSFRRRAA